MLKINSILEDMEKTFGDEIVFLTEYDGYISDIIHEKSDLMTEIYTYNLIEMAHDLYLGGYTEMAIDELGANAKDLPNLLMIADYIRQSDSLYEILNEAKIYAILYNLIKNGTEKITEEELELVKSLDLDYFEHTKDLEINIEDI